MTLRLKGRERWGCEYIEPGPFYSTFEKGVRHCPTPGACFDAPVVTGQVAGIKDPTGRVNSVRFVVDESNYAVFNITVSGSHMWDPGYVYRNVQQDSRGYVSIVSYGEGWGAGRAANLLFYAARGWSLYDNRIVQMFSPYGARRPYAQR